MDNKSQRLTSININIQYEQVTVESKLLPNSIFQISSISQSIFYYISNTIDAISSRIFEESALPNTKGILRTNKNLLPDYMVERFNKRHFNIIDKLYNTI